MSAAPLILVNGIESQSVPATDRGLAYGDGVFRTLLLRDGAPQQWERQYRKLAHDCAVLNLDVPGRRFWQPSFSASASGLRVSSRKSS